MPLPILHSYAGYSLSRLSGRKGQKPNSWKIALYGILLANAPDLDFIPGLLTGHAERFHHGPAHSFGAALLFGLFAGLIVILRKKGSFRNTFLFSSAVYASHIVLDYLGGTNVGLPLFWPLSWTRFFPAFSIFFFVPERMEHLAHAAGFRDFFTALLSGECLRRALVELAMVLFLWAGADAVAKARRREKIREAAVMGGMVLTFLFLWSWMAR